MHCITSFQIDNESLNESKCFCYEKDKSVGQRNKQQCNNNQQKGK